MGEFFKSVGEFLLTIGHYIGVGAYYLFELTSKWIKGLASEIDLPMLPSRSKILNYKYVSGTLFLLFLVYVIYINIKTYSLFVKDKENAVERKYRIRESRLLKYCLLGGALGGFLGMQRARHKTQKPTFSVGVSVMLVIQILLFSFVCGFFGFWIYMS